MTPPDVTAGQTKTADDLHDDATAMRIQYESGSFEDAGPVIDAYRAALRAMENERDDAQADEYEARAELEEMKHLVHALATIDEHVADLERGIRDTREVVEMVRDTIDRAQDYGGPCPVRTGGMTR